MFLQWSRVPARRSLHAIMLLVLLAGVSALAAPGPGGAKQPGSTTPTPYGGAESPDSSYRPYVPGEVIVKLVADSMSVDSINALYGTTVKDFFDRLNIYILSTGVAADVEALVADLRGLPGVVFAHPNYIVSPLQSVQGSIPFSDADRIGTYPDQTAALRLRLAAAHTYATGVGVKVGVIDGGVNFSHPELAGAVVSGWDFVDNDANAFDEPGGSNSGHGSFVAGVIHLAAPDAQIIAYRVADTAGKSNGDMVAEALIQAIDDGCRVINLSLVMASEHEVLRNALAYARGQDVMVIAAAGNGSVEAPTYPASDPNVLAVAAVDTLDRLAEFSRYGNHIDLCAPGERIYAPYTDTYAWWSGTSFAAPFVAGLASLKLSQSGGDLDWRSLHASLIATAENINAANPDYPGKLGAGLVNPLAAMADSVGVDTASVDPYSLVLSIPPGVNIQRCFNLYSTNPNSVFNATILGGNVTFTWSSADSVLGANTTMCFSISTVGLVEGIYSDTIQFDISGVSNSPIWVPIHLVVSDTAVVGYDASLMPAGYSFWLPEGWTQMLDACAYLTSTNAPAGYTVRLKDSTAATFIELVEPSGTTNDSVCIRLHPASLAPGLYCDTLVYSVDGVSYDLYQPVCLTIGDQPDSASVLPAYFYFAAQAGAPPQTGCAYLSTGQPEAYWLEVANGSNWLHLVDSAGMTNDSICFTVDNVSSFSPGLFVDTIFCHVNGVVNVPAIVVTLDLGDSSGTGHSASAVPNHFNYTTAPWSGGPAQAGTFVLSSTNAPASYAVRSAFGSSWLRIVDSIGITSDSIRFTVDGAGLAPGYYWDSLVCGVSGVDMPASVLVSLTILGDSSGTGSTATASPAWFTFVTGPQSGAPIQAGSFVLSSSNAPANFSAAKLFGSSWLQVVDSIGVTSDSVRFTIDATGLAYGIYSDSISCTVQGVAQPVLVPILLTVVAGEDTVFTDTAGTYPSSFFLTARLYTEAAQIACMVVWSSNAPAPFTASLRRGSAWLTLLQTSGMTNDSVCFSVTASGLSAGYYSDTIDCHVDGATNVPAIPVVLHVTEDSSGTGATASAAPAYISVAVPLGSENQMYRGFVLSSSNAPAMYSAYVLNGSAWVSIPDSSGLTNDSVRIVINPAAPFSGGTYSDSIVCIVSGVVHPVIVPVILTLTADSGGPATAEVNPSVVYYNSLIGGDNPVTRCALVTSSSTPATYTAWVADSSSSFTTLLGSTGVTGDSLCFSIDPSGLSIGVYVDTVHIGVAGVSGSLTLLVQLTVDMPKVADVGNYPNPFNPETQITFSLAAASRVRVSVYNTLGQQIAVILEDYLEAGSHAVSWRGRDDAGRPVASGVYLYRVDTGGESVTRKMLLLK